MIASAQTIPLEITDGGYIFLRMLVNGNDTARFMLDTGSGITVLSQKLFARYDLKEAGLHTGTRHNGESITGMLYILPSLSAGTFAKQDVVVGRMRWLIATVLCQWIISETRLLPSIFCIKN